MFAGPVSVQSFPNKHNFLENKFECGFSNSNFKEYEMQKQQPQNEQIESMGPIRINLQSLNNAVDFVGKLSFNDLNSMDFNGNTRLIIACAQGDLEMTKALLEQGAFPNQQNLKGQTAMFWAVTRGDISLVDVLLENGCNANIADIDGVSPLHIAASNGNTALIHRLVKTGAFLNIQDEEMETALHYAVRDCQLESVIYLINECKIDMSIRNEDGESALDLAECLCDTNRSVYQPMIAFMKIAIRPLSY